MPNQMTLGEFIDALKLMERTDADRPVRFDFVYFKPRGLHSYRGDYADLALGYASDGDDLTLRQLRELCEGALTKTFTGYKGGGYDMSENTVLWVANHNEAGRTAVVNVRDFDHEIVIDTAAINRLV